MIDTGTTFEIEVYPNFPTLSVSNDNPSSASVTATLSATGGEGGTIEYAKTSYSSTTTYAQNRGTSVTYYARSVGANGLISLVSTVSHPVGYIAPDATITAIGARINRTEVLLLYLIYLAVIILLISTTYIIMQVVLAMEVERVTVI